MGTSATSLSSLTSGVSSFNGTSQYAGDLQQAINQAVTIASIPLTELQDNVSSLQVQSSELTTLTNDFSSLQTAIGNLSSASGTNSLSATASDNSVASVTVDSSAATSAGTYTLNVVSAGSATTTLSSAGLPTVTDPSSSSISSSSTYTLTVNGSNYTVTPAADTLNGLTEAINAGDYGVTATIINIGSPTAPDYRLSLQSTSLGDSSIQLNDGTQNLLSVLAAGTPAQYQVDGQPSTPISSDSSTVTIAPGVTANLLEAGETTVTVAPDSSAAASALSAFATAYNQALSDLDANHGTSGGALTGQSIVLQLGQQLQSLVQYSGGSGGVQNLSDLGLTFNSQGQLSFDQATFESAAASDPNDVANFLGSSAGGGFLGTATNVLNGLEDVGTGLFAQTQDSYQQQITADNQEITETQSRITTMQNNLTAQMSQADATIASLESQVTYFTSLFTDTQDAIQNG
ncbi:MAG TPA: flagellar filament capping protein FliD [Bryobacteraceae bacterium]|nr:flagellar filament capping protein FliD [Bryobacteraceae bacterium]